VEAPRLKILMPVPITYSIGFIAGGVISAAEQSY